MKILKNYVFTVLFCYMVLLTMSCQQAGINSTGSEFMPDMGHSIAYEANYYNYYSYNTWDGKDVYYKYAQPRLPVKGTVARGYAGVALTDDDGQNSALSRASGQESLIGISHRPNAAAPYYYGDTEEERLRAMREIVENPYPITDAGLTRGQELYTIYCGICHGDKGDGAGYLVREASAGDVGGKYPVQPANFLLDEFIDASNGRYYHTIMFGRNMMGAHKDKLSYEERWQVIHYIRSLQAKEKELVYNQMENTLNQIEVPAGELAETHDTDSEDHSEAEAEAESDHETELHESSH